MTKRIFIFLFASLFITGVIAQNYTEIKTSQIPKKITEYLKKTLGTYTLGRAAKSNEKGVIKYEVVAASRGHKAIYVFDKDGKFLGRERNHKGKEQARPVNPVTPAGKKAEEKTVPVKK
jgi:hypothetical protein